MRPPNVVVIKCKIETCAPNCEPANAIASQAPEITFELELELIQTQMAQKPMLREIIENANGHCLNQDYGDFGAPAPALSLI
jgi:hypothetical protein